MSQSQIKSISSPPQPLQQTPLRGYILRRLKGKPTKKGSLIALAILVLVVMLLPFLAPQNPYDLTVLDIMAGRLPPGTVFETMAGEQVRFLLGTDDQGRDMLSGIFYGMRISLMVGVISVGIAVMLGVLAGLVAAYFGGFVDTVIMRLVDFVLGFPSILIALVLLAILGQGIDKVILAIVAVQWANYARIMRARALQERSKEYIQAAENLAYPKWRIMLVHLLPNCITPIFVIATVQVASAIALEATLSFLGVGVPVTEPSLGMLIKNGFDYLLSGDYWISIFPGVALLILILSINLVGDRLRLSMDNRGM